MTLPDDDLPRDPALSALYREQLPAEPPSALDAVIRAAASKALRPLPRPWWQRLQAPVALAATVMLAVMLTLTMEHNPPETQAPTPQAPAAEPEAREKARADAAPAPVRQTATPTSPGQAPAKKEAAVQHKAGAASAYRPATAQPASDSATPMTEQARTSGIIDASPQKSLAAPPLPASAAPTPAQAPGTAATNRLRNEARLQSAEEWIALIRQLRKQGKAVEAATQWQAFRNAYPDHPLPEDLRDSP
ncbi:MAG TPA: hypothetical protein PLW86_11185 [Rhodocyclaceae bacterium]|nr:hypothetical protein [Rhodocyclaceae bacterium]